MGQRARKRAKRELAAEDEFFSLPYLKPDRMNGGGYRKAYLDLGAVPADDWDTMKEKFHNPTQQGWADENGYRDACGPVKEWHGKTLVRSEQRPWA